MRSPENYPFSSFVWGGFECAYPLTKGNKRLDFLAETLHDTHCASDYELLTDLGINTVREGISWYQTDLDGKNYNFSRFERMMQIAKKMNIQQIWDLNHFDFPEDVDPFSSEFITRFEKYSVRALDVIRKHHHGQLFVVPFNEPSFMAYMGGEVEHWAPFGRNRGEELKRQIIRAMIAGMDAMWKEDPTVQYIQVDPLFRQVPDTPTNPDRERLYSIHKTYKHVTWDLISGVNPELGGSMEYMGYIGANYYYDNQELIIGDDHHDRRSYKTMDFNDPRRVPIGTMLEDLYTKYKRPIVISETGSYGDKRVPFWRRTLNEIDDAIIAGLPIHGVCSYPIIDRRDWDFGHLTNSGFWDFEDDDLECKRIPHKKTIELIKRYIKKHDKRFLA